MLDELFSDHDYHPMRNRDRLLLDNFLELDKHEDLETEQKKNFSIFIENDSNIFTISSSGK